MEYTIAWKVNNIESFKSDVLSPAINSMKENDKEADYSCYAVSRGDELGKLERIEDAINTSGQSARDKLETIERILGEI